MRLHSNVLALVASRSPKSRWRPRGRPGPDNDDAAKPDKSAPKKDQGSSPVDKAPPNKDQGQPPCSKTLCGGVCVDTSSSCAHCGKCGNACSPDEVCCNGKLVSRVGAPGADGCCN